MPDPAMHRRFPLRTIPVTTVLLAAVCSCATPAGATKPVAVDGTPSAGACVGKGVVTGYRYLVGDPIFAMMFVAAGPMAAAETFQDLHDYKISETPPKPSSGAARP